MSIRPAGFPLLRVTIYSVHFVAAKVIGNTETDGMGMDVVTGVNAVVVIHGCGFGDVPAEGVADRSRKGKTIVKQYIPDVATYQGNPLILCHSLMIREIVTEPKTEN